MNNFWDRDGNGKFDIVDAFWIALQVIAYGGGANSETVLDGQTGLLVREQSPIALEDAVRRFLAVESGFEAGALQRNAQRFGRERFKVQFLDFVNGAIRRNYRYFTSES